MVFLNILVNALETLQTSAHKRQRAEHIHYACKVDVDVER